MAYREIALFLITVALASYQQWSAGDLLWSLWVSSVVLGYAFLLTALVVRPLAETAASVRRGGIDVPMTVGGGAALAGAILLGPVLMVLFFTFHFGAFHAVHGVFLDAFFPLHDDRPTLSNDLVTGFLDATRVALSRHWPFVLISAAASSTRFRRAFKTDRKKAVRMPYRNVLRMHLMIFVVFACDFAGASGLILYLALFVYFFPTEVLRGFWQDRARDASGAA